MGNMKFYASLLKLPDQDRLAGDKIDLVGNNFRNMQNL